VGSCHGPSFGNVSGRTPNAAKDAAACDVLCRGNPDDQLPPAQGI